MSATVLNQTTPAIFLGRRYIDKSALNRQGVGSTLADLVVNDTPVLIDVSPERVLILNREYPAPFLVVGLAHILLMVDLIDKDTLRALKHRVTHWQTPILAIVHRRGDVGLACEYFATPQTALLLERLQTAFTIFRSLQSEPTANVDPAPRPRLVVSLPPSTPTPTSSAAVAPPALPPALAPPVTQSTLEKQLSHPFEPLDSSREPVHGPLYTRQIHRRDLSAVRVIGNGQFGQVFLAEQYVPAGTGEAGSDSWMRAVKMLHSNASGDDRALFLREAEVMLELNHVNLVQLVGVALQQRPWLAVLEYMPFGDLALVMSSCMRATLQLTVLEHLVLLGQVANGAEFLSSLGFIHMDLAARNCLLGANNSVKIADFGLTQKLPRGELFYTLHKTTRLPIKWLAVECILDKRFSEKSDVWAFGVFCWEVLSYGAEPFAKVSVQDLVEHLCAGHRLFIPLGTPEALRQLLQRCWNLDFDERPSFQEIARELYNVVDNLLAKHGDRLRDIGLTLENYKNGRREHVPLRQTVQCLLATPTKRPSQIGATVPLAVESNPFLRAGSIHIQPAKTALPTPRAAVTPTSTTNFAGNPFLAMSSKPAPDAIQNNPFFSEPLRPPNAANGLPGDSANPFFVPPTTGHTATALPAATDEKNEINDRNDDQDSDSDDYSDDLAAAVVAADDAALAATAAQIAAEEAEYEAFLAEKAIADARADEEARAIAAAIAENRARQAAIRAETEAKRLALEATERAAAEQQRAAQEASDRAAASQRALEQAETDAAAAALLLQQLAAQKTRSIEPPTAPSNGEHHETSPPEILDSSAMHQTASAPAPAAVLSSSSVAQPPLTPTTVGPPRAKRLLPTPPSARQLPAHPSPRVQAVRAAQYDTHDAVVVDSTRSKSPER